MIDDTRPEPSAVLFLTAADRQDAARRTYQDHFDRGVQLTGAALGVLFDRSGRWGNDRIAEVLRDHGPHSNGGTADGPSVLSPDGQAAVTPAIRRITTLAVLAVAAVAASPATTISASSPSSQARDGGHGFSRSRSTASSSPPR